MTAELEFVIGADEKIRQEGTFTVPSACSRLCLNYDLSKSYTFLVFLMVKDPAGHVRFLKQLGYSEPVIAIGGDAGDTTIGGVPGAIPAGEWKVLVFLFAEHLERLAGKGRIPFRVTVTDQAEPATEGSVTEVIGGSLWTGQEFVYSAYEYRKIYRKGAAWYRGDLHAHTRLSDGKETTQTACLRIEMMELDYYIPTEHNTLHTGWPQTDTMIVPGIEITTTLGHANLFGIDRIPAALERILADKEHSLLEKDYRDILAECAERGWLFSVNHPFLYIWKWMWRELPLAKLSCLEIINDPTYEADPEAGAGEANRRAVMLSDILWEDGWRICAVGGSDWHNRLDERYGDAKEPSLPGDPATYLYMENLSPGNLLDALRGCRAYVTRHCRIESDVWFGGMLPERADWFFYRITLTGPEEEPDIFFFHNGDRRRCRVSKKGSGIWQARGEIPLARDKYQCIRFGAATRDGEFLFYGNPVTRGEKEHRLMTFGDAADELEKRLGKRLGRQ